MPTRNTDNQSRVARPMRLRYRSQATQVQQLRLEIRRGQNDGLRTWRPISISVSVCAQIRGRQNHLGGPFAQAWTNDCSTYLITVASPARTRSELNSHCTTSLSGCLSLQDGVTHSSAHDRATPSQTQRAWSLASQWAQADCAATALDEIASPLAILARPPLQHFSGAVPRIERTS